MASNDPFDDFRRRRGSLFDEFFSDFFDRPFGADTGARPPGVRTAAPAARRPVEQVDIVSLAALPPLRGWPSDGGPAFGFRNSGAR
jgi:hypothetical protein